MTEAQMNANRENAKKSSGPKTDAGKANSSRNATKHGLTAANPLLPGEEPDGLQRLRNDLCSRFRPVGDGEELLVTRIADLQWRLGRVFSHEAAIIRDNFYNIGQKDKFRDLRYHRQKADAEKDGEPLPRRPRRPRLQHGLRRSQLPQQALPLRILHRSLHRPQPPPAKSLPVRPQSPRTGPKSRRNRRRNHCRTSRNPRKYSKLQNEPEKSPKSRSRGAPGASGNLSHLSPRLRRPRSTQIQRLNAKPTHVLRLSNSSSHRRPPQPSHSRAQIRPQSSAVREFTSPPSTTGPFHRHIPAGHGKVTPQIREPSREPS